MITLNRKLVSVIAAAMMCAYGSTPLKASQHSDSNQPAAVNPPNGYLTGAVSKLAGPKRTIVVGKFDAIGAFTQKYGEWDIGGGLAAMLTSALLESDQFIVLERANISQILSEQEMKGTGVVTEETGPSLGKVIGAQYVIYGAVTEFGTEDEGGGVSIGLSSMANLVNAGVSRQSNLGSVAVDIRVVDTTTSQVTGTYTLREKLTSTGVDVSVGYSEVDLGANRFWNTPLGGATRRVMEQSVEAILEEAKKKPWVGRVVEVDEQEMYINAGSGSGVAEGDSFVIQRVVKTFTDPQTGQVLGTRQKKLGLLKIEGVEEKLAHGIYKALGKDAPKRGDLVLAAKKPN